MEWRWVSKEIIEEAARELETNPGKINNVFQTEKKTPIHEITTAFSTEKVYDADDFHVIHTVGQVMKSFAQEGHFIIVLIKFFIAYLIKFLVHILRLMK